MNRALVRMFKNGELQRRMDAAAAEDAALGMVNDVGHADGRRADAVEAELPAAAEDIDEEGLEFVDELDEVREEREDEDNGGELPEGMDEDGAEQLREDEITACAFRMIQLNLPRRKQQMVMEISGSVAEHGILAIEDKMRQFLEEFEPTTEFFCGCCRSELETSVSSCRNERCELYRVIPRATKDVQFVACSTCRIIPQLQLLVQRYSDVLFRVHEEMRQARQLFPHCDADELYMFPRFTDWVESEEELENGNLHLSLILNSDGVRSRGQTKSTLWPIFLNVADLPHFVRTQFENVLVAAFFFTMNSLTDGDWEHFFGALHRELLVLRRGVRVVIRGRVLLVQARLVAGCLDLAALKSVFRLRGWNSVEHGCHLCVNHGRRIGGAQRFPPLQVADRVDRNQCRRDAVNGRSCFRPRRQVDPLCALIEHITPLDCVPDFLHVMDHGVLDGVIKELSPPPGYRSRRREWRLRPVHVRMLQRAYASARFPTYVRAPPSLSPSGSRTALEIRALCTVALPVACIRLLVPDVRGCGLLYLLSLLVCLYQHRGLQEGRLQAIVDLSRCLTGHWSRIYGEQAWTLKAHLLLVHCPAMMMQFGTPAQHTSHGFEAANREVQLRIDPNDKRGAFRRLMERFLMLRGATNAVMLQGEHTRSAMLMQAAAEVAQHDTGLILRDGVQYSARDQRTRQDVVDDDALQIFIHQHYNDDAVVLARVSVAGCWFSGRRLWRHVHKTQQFIAYYTNGRDVCYAIVQCFIRTAEQIHALVRPVAVASPVGRLVDHLRQLHNADDERLADAVQQFTDAYGYVAEVHGGVDAGEVEAVRAWKLTGHAVVITFLRQSYIIKCPTYCFRT